MMARGRYCTIGVPYALADHCHRARSKLVAWIARSDPGTLKQITAALKNLSSEGPALGRPLVDSITDSSLADLKELRPGSAGRSEVRLLFVFDPDRNAIILVGGDKSGAWSSSHKDAIKQAEAAYSDHLDARKSRMGRS